MTERRTAAGGLLLVAVAIPAAFLLEVLTRGEGGNGDDPAQSLVYLHEHGTAYALSGACLVLAALGVLAAATSLPWRVPFTTALGTVAGGLWVLTGALRLASPGPIGHIEEMRTEWGESAYLVVQMAGTQAGLLGGVTCLLVWIVTTSIHAWRTRALPRWLAVVGMAFLVVPLAGVLGPAGVPVSDALWFFYVALMVLGLPLWFVGTSVVLVRR